jgi:hypothetical protein
MAEVTIAYRVRPIDDGIAAGERLMLPSQRRCEVRCGVSLAMTATPHDNALRIRRTRRSVAKITPPPMDRCGQKRSAGSFSFRFLRFTR